MSEENNQVSSIISCSLANNVSSKKLCFNVSQIALFDILSVSLNCVFPLVRSTEKARRMKTAFSIAQLYFLPKINSVCFQPQPMVEVIDISDDESNESKPPTMDVKKEPEAS